MTEREDNYARTGDVVTFGRYPIHLERNEAIVSELNKCARQLPTKEDPKYWHTYEYYIERERADFMWYVDIGPFRGEYYRGVYFTEHRPITTDKTEKNHIPPQKTNGYEPRKIYWFKWEDLQWKVLMEDAGTAYLAADRIIDAQPFYSPKEEVRTIDGVRICQNNYAHSDIRLWLNKDFLEDAFTEQQIARIVRGRVDNSAEGNRFACENTEDRVFLLSNSEAEALFDSRSDRIRKPSDYAKCQGAFAGSERSEAIAHRGQWWLRTPDQFGSNFSCCVDLYGGCLLSNHFDCFTDNGVVPAMIVKL